MTPVLKYSERYPEGYPHLKILGLKRLLTSGPESWWYFVWFTSDNLEDVKHIQAGIFIKEQGKGPRWGSLTDVYLNTIQPDHEEYNINKYISKIFNIAYFDKLIENFDEKGKPAVTDRATFILATNWSKLPCVEKVNARSEEELEKLPDFTQLLHPEITKEELVNSSVFGDVMLRSLEAKGLTVDDLPGSHTQSSHHQEWLKEYQDNWVKKYGELKE